RRVDPGPRRWPCGRPRRADRLPLRPGAGPSPGGRRTTPRRAWRGEHPRAAREPGLGELDESTRRALVLAGDSTMGLDVARAEAYYRQALDLCPAGTPGRSRVLARAARAAFQVGRVAEAASGYQEGIAGFCAGGDGVGQGG